MIYVNRRSTCRYVRRNQTGVSHLKIDEFSGTRSRVPLWMTMQASFDVYTIVQTDIIYSRQERYSTNELGGSRALRVAISQ